MKRTLLCLSLVLSLAACSSVTNTGTTAATSRSLIPNQVIKLTAKTSVSLANVVGAGAVAAAIYLVYDPLAPNWEIEESRLNDDTYRLSLKMKRYHTGGAGESIQILKRRAGQLQDEQGFGNYQILEYNEGIESQTLGARRVAEGKIRLVQRQQADSFMLNEAN